MIGRRRSFSGSELARMLPQAHADSMVARCYGLALAFLFAALATRRAVAQLLPPSRDQPARPRPTTIPASLNRVFLDLKGDGLDLAWCDASTRRRAPRAASDDTLLAIDVAAAGKAGYRVATTSGAMGRFVPCGSGLQVTLPDGTHHQPGTGWALLSLVETTRDGFLDKSDLFWPALRLARDSNGDGLLQDGEVQNLAVHDVVRVGARAPATTERDKHGNELAYGAFARADRTTGTMADVTLASCK